MSGRKYNLVFSNLAFEDISEIQTYTELTFGSTQKSLYEGKLQNGFAQLSKHPEIGHIHKLLPKNLRVFIIEKHIIIYQISEEDSLLQIVRIVHQKVNLSEISL